MAQRSARLSDAQLASYARQAGFSEDKIPTIVGIARAESGGNPLALNPNRSTGDESYGLMQVNMIDEPGYQLGQERLRQFGLKSKSDLYDPLTNMRAAKAIYDSQGPNAWSVYKSGAYKQYVPGAESIKNTGVNYGGTSAAAGGLDMKSDTGPAQLLRAALSDDIISQSLGVTSKPDVTKKNTIANEMRDSILKTVMQGAITPFGGGLF